MVDEASELSGEGIVFDAKTREVIARCGYRLRRDAVADGSPAVSLEVDMDIDDAEPAARDRRLLTLQTAGGGYQSFRISAVDRQARVVAATPEGPLRTEFAEARPSKDGRQPT